MNTCWRSHWLWLVLVTGLITTADYFDHILRPDAPFGQRPWDWLGFTAASLVSVLLVAYGLARGLARLPVPDWLTDTLAMAAAVAFHLLIGGPLWNRIFWPDGSMQFDAIWLPMAVAALAYLLYRGIFWLMVWAMVHLHRRLRAKQ